MADIAFIDHDSGRILEGRKGVAVYSGESYQVYARWKPHHYAGREPFVLRSAEITPTNEDLAALNQQIVPQPDGVNRQIVEVTPGVFQFQPIATEAIPSAPLHVQFPDLSGEKWETLVKGLPATPRGEIRTAAQAAVALVPSDADTDAAFLAASRQRRAGRFILDFEMDHPYLEVVAALERIGFTMNASRTTALQTRWTAVLAL